jgi:hypothetical protein
MRDSMQLGDGGAINRSFRGGVALCVTVKRQRGGNVHIFDK